LATVGQLSQAFPIWSMSVSAWFAFAVSAQLSQTSPTPSASRSSWSVFASVDSRRRGRRAVPVGVGLIGVGDRGAVVVRVHDAVAVKSLCPPPPR